MGLIGPQTSVQSDRDLEAALGERFGELRQLVGRLGHREVAAFATGASTPGKPASATASASSSKLSGCMYLVNAQNWSACQLGLAACASGHRQTRGQSRRALEKVATVEHTGHR